MTGQDAKIEVKGFWLALIILGIGGFGGYSWGHHRGRLIARADVMELMMACREGLPVK